MNRSRTTSKPKYWRYLLWCIIVVLWRSILFRSFSITMTWEYTIEKWDTYHTLLQQLSPYQRIRMRYWLSRNAESLPSLKPGTVVFSGSYQPSEWIEVIEQATTKTNIVRLTLLEGWSSYDIEAKLIELWLVNSGEYRNAIEDRSFIDQMSTTYPWLSEQWVSLVSLEWYLYPDTYFIDTRKDIVSQLVTAQLKAYQDRVWTPYRDQIRWFSQKLRSDDFSFDLTPYSLMRLASVIENEEKANQNKPMIAGIFLNRIQENMRLDADITLCYGKWVTYRECTPSFIVQHLYDSSNPYNTRQVGWLPPTPISNPSIATIKSLLEYQKSNYLYYLHDAKGVIYPAATLPEHNSNKVRYL